MFERHGFSPKLWAAVCSDTRNNRSDIAGELNSNPDPDLA